MDDFGNTYGASRFDTDAFSNEYVLGCYYDTGVTFGVRHLTNPHSDSACYFLAKVNSSGNVLWMHNIGNSCGTGVNVGQLGNSITTDSCGNVYFALGYIHNLTIGNDTFVNRGSWDILLAKYDSSGAKIWAKSFGGNGPDGPAGISVTPSGNIYIAGMFKSDTLAFATHLISDTLIANNFWSMFLAKLDNEGNPIWAKTHSGSVDCETYGLAVDKFENPIITGCYSVGYHQPAAVFFDAITLPVVPNYQVYGFVTKYDSTGTASWAKCTKGSYLIQYGLTIDPCDNVWINGVNLSYHYDTLIYDTIDNHVLASPPRNWNPVFIAAWNDNGNYITSSSLETGSGSLVDGIASDRAGNIYIVGQSRLDTFIVANDSLYNTTGPTYQGHPVNTYVAKYNPGLGCTYKQSSTCPSVANITELKTIKELHLFPNPVNDKLILSSNNPLGLVSIYDVTGRCALSVGCSSKTTEICVANLASGLYFVKIGNETTKKFVKL